MKFKINLKIADNGNGKFQLVDRMPEGAINLCKETDLYDARCLLWEHLGSTRSDAQAVVDAEDLKGKMTLEYKE